MLKAKKFVDQLTPYVAGVSVAEVAESLGVTDVIKMASNENPLGPGVDISQMYHAFNSAHVYPHNASATVLAKLAKKYSVQPQQLILGNGSDEILQMLALSYLEPSDDVLISERTFSVYRSVSTLFGAQITTVPMTNYRYDLENFLHHVTPKTKVIFIANPNNPTGTIVSHDEIVTFLDALPPTVFVVMDEAYAEYVESANYPKMVHLLDRFPNVIILRTFSKLYGLAGLRIGYGIAHTDIISTLQRVRQPFNINSIALEAASFAIDAHDHIEKSLALNKQGKRQLYDALRELGVTFIETEANFICIFLPISGKEAMNALIKKGIIIRPLESFGLPNAIRVTIGKEDDNRRFISALKTLI